jgi:hypothetical protein
MAMSVDQRLLYDSKQSCFDVLRQPPERRRQIEVDRDPAAIREAFCVPAQRRQ